MSADDGDAGPPLATVPDGAPADALIDFLEDRGAVSLNEIETFLEGEIPLEGDWWWGRHDMNVFFWIGMSAEFYDLMAGLANDDRIHVRPAEPGVYLTDGVMPGLEMARRIPDDGYVDERWLPVTVRPGPDPDPDIEWGFTKRADDDDRDGGGGGDDE